MHTTIPTFRLDGWRLFGCLALIVVLFALSSLLMYPDLVLGVRSAVRVTARTSFVLFLAAFTASAFAILVPSPLTRSLMKERRYIGLAFAFSHLVHAILIYTYGQISPEFWPGRTWIGNLPGSVGYIFIILLALTSFKGPASVLGPKSWKRLHTTGVWVIAAVFCYSYFMRISMDAIYAIPYGILFAAIIIRLMGKASKRTQAARRVATASIKPA